MAKRILTLTNVVLLFVVIVCALTGYYVICLGYIVRPEWELPAIISGILSAALVCLYVWQVRKRRFFPLISRPWLISLLPFIFILAAFLAHRLPVQGSDSIKATDLSFIFGAVSLVSLVFSVAVLATLRETVHDELQQMDAAINLIQLAKKKLIFIALTPNLGYARAVYRQKWDLCNEFIRVFDAKLNELITKAARETVEIRIGILGNSDCEHFYRMKEDTLRGLPARDYKKDAAAEYKGFTESLMARVADVRSRGEALNDSTKFQYVEWKEHCIVPDASGNTSDYPPLSILIADDHTAIIQFNSRLLSPEPVDLGGRILRSPEEIQAFSLLVDSYLAQYKR